MAKLFIRYNARQNRCLSRIVKRVSNPLNQSKEIEQPQIQQTGQYDRRQDGSYEDSYYIAKLENQARGRAVHNRPADEHKEDSRNAASSNYSTDSQRVSGKEQYEPGKCDQVELITDGR